MSRSGEVVLSAGSPWWLAIRPRTLTMAIVPVVTGAVIAYAETARFALVPFLAALTVALAVQIGTNLLNDASDGESGLDRPGRLGPPRVTAEGLIKASEVKRAALLAFLAAALAGAVALVEGGLPILFIGIASLAAGWAYSRGPRPISATPFGEVFVLAFFGVAAVIGTHWLIAKAPSLVALLSGVVVGLPAAAVLLVNNHRDRDGDAIAGRRTLAIVLGIDGARRLYGALLIAAAVLGLPVALAAGAMGPALTMLATPLAASLYRLIAVEPIGRGLNALLARTARYQVIVAALLIAGLLARM